MFVTMRVMRIMRKTRKFLLKRILIDYSFL